MNNGVEIVSKTLPKIRERLRVQTPKLFFQNFAEKVVGSESFLLVFIALRETAETFLILI